MKSIFQNFFGNSSKIRLFEALITGREFDYSLTNMAKNAGIGWNTLHRIFSRLQKQKIVLETREIDRAKLYKLNQENQEVKKLIQLYDSLIKKQLDYSRFTAGLLFAPKYSLQTLTLQ